MKKYAILILFVTLTAQISLAQSNGNWIIYFGQTKFSERWSMFNEVQYRNYNAIGKLEQLLTRHSVGYALQPNNHYVSLGYGYILAQPISVLSGLGPELTHEHRIFQQFLSTQQIGRVKLTHRYRIEERFFRDDFKVRFRYFLAVNIPFNHKTIQKNTVYLSLYDEVFLQPEALVFDRNRLYGAIGFAFTPNLKLELGYMSQALSNYYRNQFQIVLHHTIDTSRK
jgi:hypothetical protein